MLPMKVCFNCNIFVDDEHNCPPSKYPPIELDGPYLTMKAIPTRTGKEMDTTIYGGD